MSIPHLIVIDDLFGRCLPCDRNADRENLCASFLWQDDTGDISASKSRQRVINPLAKVVFCRGQSPTIAVINDSVENDLEMALKAVRKGWYLRDEHHRSSNPNFLPWSMVLLDLCFFTGLVTLESHRRTPGMPEGRMGDDDPRSYYGLILLDAIHREFPELPIFILSSKPRDDVSLEFSRRGALGFIDRSHQNGSQLVQEALWNHGLLPDPNGVVVGNSLSALLALREARRASRHHENVLIRGERGSGKELFARYLHQCWVKWLQNGVDKLQGESLSSVNKIPPLVTLNSAVLTQSLFSSELFGIEAKTATGVAAKIGLVESANGGDLFLDEIADMRPEVQAAMLRVLQERHVTRVGGRQSIPVDVRFISATNANLEAPEIGFRADLLDRLRIGGSVLLPPLRERMSDISLLADRFLREAEAFRPGIKKRAITSEAFDLLLAHNWPGNIRELRTIIFEAVTRHPDVEYLVPDHLRIRENEPVKTEGLHRYPAEAEQKIKSLDELIVLLEHFAFDERNATVWAGKLPRLQQAIRELLITYLRSGLLATRKPTPENPAGELRIHPALKLITGDATLTASKAADIIKKLTRLSAADHNTVPTDPLIYEALEIALRLRPTSSSAKSKKLESTPIKDAS